MKLVIAEKNSVAKSIAEVIGAKTRKDGYYEGNGYIVTYCVGHLISTADPEAYDEKYKKWSIADLPIIPQAWKNVPREDTMKQLNTIRDLTKRKDVQTIINACDAGREGEMICMELYHYFQCKKPVKRLWITSLEEKSIKDGFNNLRDGADYENLYRAAVCRSQADWLVGMNFTRNYSKLYDSAGVMAIGRVLTPTLAMIVNRDEKIRNFIKVPFYVVQLSGNDFIAENEKTENKDTAEAIANACNGQTARVTSVERKEKKDKPPKLYDLTNLQKEANNMFGYTAAKVLEVAQELYQLKILTYPRTDSQYITDDMAGGIPSLVQALDKIMPFSIEPCTTNINTESIVKNAGVTDHHAIIPTTTATSTDLSKLTTEQKHILLMVATKLLCAVGENHIYAETTVLVECKGNTFKAKGKTVTQDGWKAIVAEFADSTGRKKSETDKSLPDIQEGMEYTATANVREGTSEPPKPYTEATLLGDMERAGAEDMPEDAERKGIGTPATRAATIERLLKLNYVERSKKNLTSTPKGQNLIAVMPENDPVKLPKMTGEWESDLKYIEKGKLDADAFMKSIGEYVTQSLKENNTPTELGKTLFPPKSYGENTNAEVISICPKCGGNIIEKTKVFGCNNRECKYALYKDNKLLTSAKKKLTLTMAKELFQKGKVSVKGMYSAKKDTTYDAVLVLVETETGWLGLGFEKK